MHITRPGIVANHQISAMVRRETPPSKKGFTSGVWGALLDELLAGSLEMNPARRH
jgi:hypothetical protein